MKARVEHSPFAFTVDIWLYEEPFDGGVIRVAEMVDGKSWNLVEYQHGAEKIPPTLTLPPEAVKEIVRAASKMMLAEDATVDALKDARATRDRTFALLEKVVSDA